MLLESNELNEIITGILEAKISKEKLGHKPRVVLVGSKIFDLIEEEWLESVKELPWGDSLVYEMERKKELNKNVFLGDGSIFGLWVIRVDTIDGFDFQVF